MVTTGSELRTVWNANFAKGISNPWLFAQPIALCIGESLKLKDSSRPDIWCIVDQSRNLVLITKGGQLEFSRRWVVVQT